MYEKIVLHTPRYGVSVETGKKNVCMCICVYNGVANVCVWLGLSIFPLNA